MQSSPRIEELRQKFHENPRRYFAPLANEYRKAGDPEQAIAICRAHLAQQPGHMSGHVVYGQALYDAGRIDEANSVFRQALALDPENMIVLRHLGDIARQRGEIEEARSWYSRALDGDPQDTEVAAYLAELTEPLVVTEPGSSTAPAPEPEAVTAEEPMPHAEAEAPETFADSTIDEAIAEPVQEPVAQVADTSFDTTFDELILDEGMSEPATHGATVSDDSPYLDDSESMVDEVAPQPVEESLLAVEASSPAEEAEAADTSAAAEREEEPAAPEPPPEDRSYRSTPAYEGSPIITRTLAELYLEQGYIEPALEIYRQLAEREPHDTTLQARISEISADAQEEAASSTAEESAGGSAESMDEPLVEPEASLEPAEEDQEATTTASEPLTDIWDAPDSWGADMFEDIDEGAEIFGMTATSFEETRSAAGEFEAASAEEPETEQPPTLEAEPALEEEPASTLEEAIAQADAEIQSEPDIEPAQVEETPLEEPVRGITIREFFATLGSMRPPTANGEDAYAPEQEESAAEAQPSEDQQYPYADDAFASLFQDAPVSAEDSRAAAALSSAVAHKPPAAGISTPAESRPARQADESTTSEQTMQESEEDIRRFREWLDGLANS
jgi:tetratricopeptide (TPR) repeat protein